MRTPHTIGLGAPITESELIAQILQGGIWAIGEYRLGKADVIKWRDKTSGKAMEGVVARHTIECGAEALVFSPRLPEGYAVADFGPLLPKGTKCALQVNRVEVDKGNTTVSGTLHEVQS